ncbi:MAG: 1,2-phenylacetyl-CoA epoxidase subunit PaaC [Actinomycetota bacterium]
MSADLFTHVLRQADRAFVLSHRLAQWLTHAPELEEDMALANISLDLLGQARQLYTYAGELEGAGRDEDHFAYWRTADDFRNPLLVEQPNGDFAVTMVRQVLHDHGALLYWESMTTSTDERLASLAARAVNETRFHLRHSAGWLVRLGDGTDESHRRTQAALHLLWPYADELLGDPDEHELRTAGVVGPSIDAAWHAAVAATIRTATLALPSTIHPKRGGLHGQHSEHLPSMLTELQALARAHPEATW